MMEGRRRVYIDDWNTIEKIYLICGVNKFGEDWKNIADFIRPKLEDEYLRPPDWYTADTCAAQYDILVRKYVNKNDPESWLIQVGEGVKAIWRKEAKDGAEEAERRSRKVRKRLQKLRKGDITFVKYLKYEEYINDFLNEFNRKIAEYLQLLINRIHLKKSFEDNLKEEELTSTTRATGCLKTDVPPKTVSSTNPEKITAKPVENSKFHVRRYASNESEVYRWELERKPSEMTNSKKDLAQDVEEIRSQGVLDIMIKDFEEHEAKLSQRMNREVNLRGREILVAKRRNTRNLAISPLSQTDKKVSQGVDNVNKIDDKKEESVDISKPEVEEYISDEEVNEDVVSETSNTRSDDIAFFDDDFTVNEDAESTSCRTTSMDIDNRYDIIHREHSYSSSEKMKDNDPSVAYGDKEHNLECTNVEEMNIKFNEEKESSVQDNDNERDLISNVEQTRKDNSQTAKGVSAHVAEMCETDINMDLQQLKSVCGNVTDVECSTSNLSNAGVSARNEEHEAKLNQRMNREVNLRGREILVAKRRNTRNLAISPLSQTDKKVSQGVDNVNKIDDNKEESVNISKPEVEEYISDEKVNEDVVSETSNARSDDIAFFDDDFTVNEDAESTSCRTTSMDIGNRYDIIHKEHSYSSSEKMKDNDPSVAYGDKEHNLECTNVEEMNIKFNEEKESSVQDNDDERDLISNVELTRKDNSQTAKGVSAHVAEMCETDINMDLQLKSVCGTVTDVECSTYNLSEARVSARNDSLYDCETNGLRYVNVRSYPLTVKRTRLPDQKEKVIRVTALIDRIEDKSQLPMWTKDNKGGKGSKRRCSLSIDLPDTRLRNSESRLEELPLITKLDASNNVIVASRESNQCSPKITHSAVKKQDAKHLGRSVSAFEPGQSMCKSLSKHVDEDPQSSTRKVQERESRMLHYAYYHFQTQKYSDIFQKPITNEQVEGYHDVVLNPMDLKTIKRLISENVIDSIPKFQYHTLLMLNNAMIYNGLQSSTGKMAREIAEATVPQTQYALEMLEKFIKPDPNKKSATMGDRITRRGSIQKDVDNI